VVGFGLYGSIHGPSEYQVNIQILQTGAGRILASNDLSFLSDGTNSTFRYKIISKDRILFRIVNAFYEKSRPNIRCPQYLEGNYRFTVM